MKIQDTNGTERNETRQEIVARHQESLRIQQEGFNLLETLRSGDSLYIFRGDLKGLAAVRAESLKRKAEAQREEGLTTEINTSKSLVSLRDTVESAAEVIRRHPNGFKGFIRGSKGDIKVDPYTPEENAEAEAWLSTLNVSK